jgi:hypothetical protein
MATEPPDAADDVLGRLTLAALAATESGVPVPPHDAHPLPAVRRPWGLAGVKSNEASMNGARQVLIRQAGEGQLRDHVHVRAAWCGPLELLRLGGVPSRLYGGANEEQVMHASRPAREGVS